MTKESVILNNIDFPCYSACPPWFKVCTDNCVDKPWFLQETYQKLFNQDSAFRKQAMEYLFSVLNPSETCYSACPPWFQICSQQCMKSPWYLQEQWLQEMTTIDEFRQIVFEFLIESLSPVIEKTQKSPKIMNEDTSNVCYPACPPFVDSCTDECAFEPWFNQKKWNERLFTDSIFRTKSFEHMYNVLNLNTNCNSACPPWFTVCTYQCMNMPWFKQSVWIHKMEQDEDFLRKAIDYLVGQLQSEEASHSVNKPSKLLEVDFDKCYSACPPWESVCSKQCMNEPWYKSKRYIDEFKEKDEFRRASFSYLRQIHEKEQECYSECPPWFSTCTYQCLPYPWYFSNEWFEIMNKDSTFVSQCFEFLITTLEEHEQQQQQQNQHNKKASKNSDICFETCPPWFKTCPVKCESIIWYMQDQNKIRIRNSKGFRTITIEYFKQRGALNKCFSACPPCFDVCTDQCMSKPWYEQETWTKKMKTDSEFRRQVLEYWTSHQKGQCFSSCPPWYEVCTQECVDRPWYEQEKWIKLMQTDDSFYEKFFTYLDEHGTEQPCFSACPPWFKECNEKCADEPWFLQENWVSKMKSDKEFSQIANEYLPK